MEASCGSRALQHPAWTRLEKPRSRSSIALADLHKKPHDKSGFQLLNMRCSMQGVRTENSSFTRSFLRRSQVFGDSRGSSSMAETRKLLACLNTNDLLKKKARDVSPVLNGRCIFLVGMMGSGKTTVGKVLAEVLGYCFVDSDRYIEGTMGGGTSVRQIFMEFGETRFREYESEALRHLAQMPQIIVATGGGAVERSINWEYMKQGITVHLDVPLDALAKRIAAVGTDSRPLLDFEAGDAYMKAFMGLFTLSKKRADAYSHANTRVSMQHIADEMDLDDVADITPMAIALEVLNQVEKYLDGNKSMPV